MKTMSVSLFKAKALKTVAHVAQSQECIIITKRGKPMAKIVPYQYNLKKAIPGKLAEALVFEKDIVSPLGESMWEASR